MRRVELLSENRLQKPSTSVAILLKFPLRRAKWRAQRFSSLLIMTENEAVSGSRYAPIKGNNVIGFLSFVVYFETCEV